MCVFKSVITLSLYMIICCCVHMFGIMHCTRFRYAQCKHWLSRNTDPLAQFLVLVLHHQHSHQHNKTATSCAFSETLLIDARQTSATGLPVYLRWLSARARLACAHETIEAHTRACRGCARGCTSAQRAAARNSSRPLNPGRITLKRP